MEISNASLYDGGTAIAEAVLMANSVTGRKEIVVGGCVNPMKLAVLDTYLKAGTSRSGGPAGSPAPPIPARSPRWSATRPAAW